MREFCWLYKLKANGLICEVQRPRRRSVGPVYRVRYKGTILSFDIDAKTFREQFEYIGKNKAAHEMSLEKE